MRAVQLEGFGNSFRLSVVSYLVTEYIQNFFCCKMKWFVRKHFKQWVSTFLNKKCAMVESIPFYETFRLMEFP